MWCAVRDYEMEQLEAELEASRFGKWDVETLLADRHRAKIEALTRPQPRWQQHWQIAKEISQLLLTYIGSLTVLAAFGYWALIAV